MKKTKDKSDDLVAFNTRVHRPIKETVKESSKLAGVNMEDIAHDAWRFYFGINDEMLDHRRKLVIAAAKKVTGGKLPFNAPWPPTKSNAIAPAPCNGIAGLGFLGIAESNVHEIYAALHYCSGAIVLGLSALVGAIRYTSGNQ